MSHEQSVPDNYYTESVMREKIEDLKSKAQSLGEDDTKTHQAWVMGMKIKDLESLLNTKQIKQASLLLSGYGRFQLNFAGDATGSTEHLFLLAKSEGDAMFFAGEHAEKHNYLEYGVTSEDEKYRRSGWQGVETNRNDPTYDFTWPHKPEIRNIAERDESAIAFFLNPETIIRPDDIRRTSESGSVFAEERRIRREKRQGSSDVSLGL